MEKFRSQPRISSLERSEEVFTLLGVDPSVDENLRIIDRDGDLYLLHYIEYKQEVSHVKGTVVHLPSEGKATIKAVSYPHTTDYTPTEFEKVESTLPLNFERAHITVAEEGTIIRLFSLPSESGVARWFCTTHRRLNFHQSAWAGPDFGTLFHRIWPWSLPFSEVLDPSRCYVFLLSHPENRIICQIPKPSLKLVAIYSPLPDGRMKWEPPSTYGPACTDEEIPFSISYPIPISTSTELIEKGSGIDWKEATGLLYYDPSLSLCFKIVPGEYERLRKIRGNEPKILARYLELSPEEKKELRFLYPTQPFDLLERRMTELPQRIMDHYRIRYEKHRYLFVSSEEHQILLSVHHNPEPQKERLIQGEIRKTHPRSLVRILGL